MKVLLGQVPVVARDQWQNVQTVVDAIDGAPEADLAVFPEMALLPCTTCARSRARALVPSAEVSPELTLISEGAARNGTAVIVGFAEAGGDAFRNSAACFDADGALVGIYRKTHLFGDDEVGAFAAGKAYLVWSSPACAPACRSASTPSSPKPAAPWPWPCRVCS